MYHLAAPKYNFIIKWHQTELAPDPYQTVFLASRISISLCWIWEDTFKPLQLKQILCKQISTLDDENSCFKESLTLRPGRDHWQKFPWLMMWYALLIVCWIVPSVFNSSMLETMIATTRLIITKLKIYYIVGICNKATWVESQRYTW